jgi:hypothetical protein
MAFPVIKINIILSLYSPSSRNIPHFLQVVVEEDEQPEDHLHIFACLVFCLNKKQKQKQKIPFVLWENPRKRETEKKGKEQQIDL